MDGGAAPLKSAVAEAGFIPIGFGSTQARSTTTTGARQPARIDTSGLPPSTMSDGDLSSSSCSACSACSEDDGFTPVTPGIGLRSAPNNTSSPTSRAGGVTGLSPRDALGIPLSKILRYASFRSQQRPGAHEDQPPPLPRLVVGENKSGDHDEYYEDVTPLSPRTPLSARIRFGLGNFGGGGGAPQGDVEKGLTVKPQKSVRQTLFGLVEGWWELGLLERGKSLKRNGAGAQR